MVVDDQAQDPQPVRPGGLDSQYRVIDRTEVETLILEINLTLY